MIIYSTYMTLQKKLNNFTDTGFLTLEELLDKKQCKNLLNEIMNNRDWSENLFRKEAEVKNDSKTIKTNPGKGVNNLAEEFDLNFIEQNEVFVKCLNKLVGENYQIILKKFVVGVPEKWIPNYCKEEISKQLAANLGFYIKPEYRNVTYFRGIDYHMDLIDHPGQIGDYVTVYVYLNDVTNKMSPLHIIEKSHIFGPTKFPHFIKNDKEETIEYGENEENYSKFNKKILTGKTGTVYFWSSMTLHGTKPTSGDDFRISLRYTIKKNSNSNNNKGTLIDDILNSFKKNNFLQKVRDDIKDHKQIKFNKRLK